MAPNLFGTSAALYVEAAQQDVHQDKSTVEKTSVQKLLSQKLQNENSKYEWKIVWRNVIAFSYLHIGTLYGLYLCFTAARFYTILWLFAVAMMAGVGVTAGTHRLWAHRSYKAKWPLRVLLMIWQTMAFQNHIYEWVRDHRVHHKFTDTDADPHNSKRGFFFSHMGWLMLRKHSDVKTKGFKIDMSDLEKDPVVVWQRRFYIILMPLFCFAVPTWIPCHFWDERPMNSWYICLLRYCVSLHITWLVNSAAHMWGMRPYDRNISPTDNRKLAPYTFGESWHNYHHVFPWDYKTGELGEYRTNFSAGFIDLCARLGLAYDLKTVNPDMIDRRSKKTGDGSRCERDKDQDHHNDEHNVWGWGDADMKEQDKKAVEISHKAD